jgi:N-succinyl-L-ornithine transcarbamylase
MRHFTSVNDVKDIHQLIRSARSFKAGGSKITKSGTGKVLGLIFMNPSLRTRLSTQKAGINLGMEVMVMNFSGDGWALETRSGVIMDGNKAEHIIEASAVLGEYCDIIGIRSFPGLIDKDLDYREEILNSLIKYSGVPVISLESATRHPLQSLADMITIEEFKDVEKPRVVMTWAPHPRALPQSVPNSFVEWATAMDYDLIVTHPRGYELSGSFMKNVTIEHDQDKALEGADFVYVKNWSSYYDYGKVLSVDPNWMINLEKLKVTRNARVMHCLPVRRNVVIADDVLDSDRSIVIAEAANRVFAAQAVVHEILNSFG